MNTKPIKRSPHIQPLSRDHHFTLLFCWKIRKGLKNGSEIARIKKYVQYFWEGDMKPHFREEEEILFALVKDEKVEKALNDHKQIGELVDRVLKSSSEGEARELLPVLADTIDAHVRYEERDLFPHLEQNLTATQLEAIGEQLKAEPAPQDNYVDEFWENK